MRLDILVMFLLLNPPLVVKPGVLPPASFFVHLRSVPAVFSGPVEFLRRREEPAAAGEIPTRRSRNRTPVGEDPRRLPEDFAGKGSYVLDASKMLAMDPSSIASNSSSVCCAVSPSVRAREKLAMTPGLRAIRALASSRV